MRKLITGDWAQDMNDPNYINDYSLRKLYEILVSHEMFITKISGFAFQSCIFSVFQKMGHVFYVNPSIRFIIIRISHNIWTLFLTSPASVWWWWQCIHIVPSIQLTQINRSFSNNAWKCIGPHCPYTTGTRSSKNGQWLWDTRGDKRAII